MGSIAIRLEPRDEYMHELGPEPNFNESMYFNLYDPTTQVGGFFRLGNRANEGTGEMTACLYLPDGRVEAVFEGPPKAVALLVDWCGAGPPLARVSAVAASDEPVTGETSFAIR